MVVPFKAGKGGGRYKIARRFFVASFMIGPCIYSRSALQYQQGNPSHGNFYARRGQIIAKSGDSARSLEHPPRKV
jgi:hypothetical protein